VPQDIGIGCTFRSLKQDLYVRLCCEVVDLVWLDALYDAQNICGLPNQNY